MRGLIVELDIPPSSDKSKLIIFPPQDRNVICIV